MNGRRSGSRRCTPTASRTHSSTERDPGDGVGGFGAFFLLLDDPEVYGLPPDPVVTTHDLPSIWGAALAAAGTLAALVGLAFVGSRS